MTARYLTALITGVLTVLLLSPSAYAVDQLPLPNPGISPVSADIIEFASNTLPQSSAGICAHILKSDENYQSDEKVKAIKAYRQCRAEHALQQLAVWRWQDNSN